MLQENTIAWKKVHIYQTIFQSTLDTSLQDLQYKIVTGVLPTNTLLIKYDILFTYLRALCNNNEETISQFVCVKCTGCYIRKNVGNRIT